MKLWSILTELRRYPILLRKKFHFRRQNVRASIERARRDNDVQAAYDVGHDEARQTQHQSITLLDFALKEDFFLVDHVSDATEFGGETQSTLSHHRGEHLRLQSSFRRERDKLAPISTLFAGFKCDSLFRRQFPFFNGLRVELINNGAPVKVGVNLLLFQGQFESFTGVIVDRNHNWTSYELPFFNMLAHSNRELMTNAPFFEHYELRNFFLLVESSDEQACDVRVRRVEIINNPEFSLFREWYKLPVFVKTSASFAADGFVDNGRQYFSLLSKQE